MQIKEFNNLTFGIKYPVIPANELAKRIRHQDTYSKIAADLNVPDYVVAKSINHTLTDFANGKYNDKIYELYKQNYSVSEIRNMLGYPIKYVKLVIKRMEAEERSKLNTNILISSIIRKFKLDKSVLKNLKD